MINICTCIYLVASHLVYTIDSNLDYIASYEFNHITTKPVRKKNQIRTILTKLKTMLKFKQLHWSVSVNNLFDISTAISTLWTQT